jgi:hypothetical protein
MNISLRNRTIGAGLVAAALTALGALTAVGSPAAQAATVTSQPGVVTVRLDADEVPRTAGNVPFAQGICTTDMHLSASSQCTHSLQECAQDEDRNRSPLFVGVDPATGALISCVPGTSTAPTF